MAKNKIIYNGNTLIDLTGDTVTADKLLQGYTAHDRSGALIIGTATQGGSVTQDQDGFIVLPPDGSGGGGGGSKLEYEEGIYEPSADINQPTINFSKTHDALPSLIMMTDISETPQTVDNSNLYFTFSNWYSCFGDTTKYGTYSYYARQAYGYVYNSGNSMQQSGYAVNGLDSASTSRMGFWVTTSAFMPRGSTSTYWRAGRTYKWIAVWR